MRTLYRLLLRLYPERVRSEFSTEMLQVFDEASQAEKQRGHAAFLRFCAREAGGLIASLLVQERSMKHKRPIIHGALAGLLIGVVFAAAWAARPYTSKAVLRPVPSMIPERLVPAQNQLELSRMLPNVMQTVASRGSLANVINTHGLYPGERARHPMEAVIERMREAIHVTPASGESLEISFSYTDPIVAQKVLTDLMGRIVAESARHRTVMATLTVRLLKDSAEQAGAAWEASLAKARATPGSRTPSDRVKLDADIARQRYEELSSKVAEAEMLKTLEARQQGQTIDVLDMPSLPVDLRPSVLLSAVVGSLIGAFTGWLVSILFAYRSKEVLAEPI